MRFLKGPAYQGIEVIRELFNRSMDTDYSAQIYENSQPDFTSHQQAYSAPQTPAMEPAPQTATPVEPMQGFHHEEMPREEAFESYDPAVDALFIERDMAEFGFGSLDEMVEDMDNFMDDMMDDMMDLPEMFPDFPFMG